MEPLLLITIFASFFCTFLIMPFWIRKAKQIGLTWEDMHKFKSDKNVAGSGGIIVVLGTMIGIFAYVAIQTFYFKNFNGTLIGIFAILSSMFLITGVGLIDDLFGWKKGGMSIRSRVILILFAAVPLMVINAGESNVLGIELGLLFPLLAIPVGVLGAATTFNMIAGYNGLETGQGIIILSAMAIVTYLTGTAWLSVVALCMVASLFAFYIFNVNPAKVFPGDVLTYSVGALIAAIAIVGNVEKIALFFFIPYFIEVVLKLRAKITIRQKGFVQNFGVPNEDNSLELRYKKIYSITHLSLWTLKKINPSKKVYENEVVWLINGFQILIVLVGFWIFM
jgi:UDP-N-acetylglucosamine--dolichyl-phosphate N-acetylglucosaminephosphotransferase